MGYVGGVEGGYKGKLGGDVGFVWVIRKNGEDGDWVRVGGVGEGMRG